MKKGGMLRSLSLGILITSLLIPVSILAQDGTSSTVETSLSTVADSDTSISPATTEPLVTETPISTTSELLPDTTQETREVSTEEEGSLVPESAQVSIPIYRLYHPGIGRHLYTTDENEKNIRYNEGWGYEGIAWYAPGQGTPVYRLYNATLKNHLYTQDRNEVRVLTSLHGWKSDFNGQPVFYSGGEISVYRLYNRNLQGRHHWTTDTNEYRVLPNHGWTQEGIKFKALQIGKPIQTQYKENIPSGSADISNTRSRVTIEADVSLSGTGTGDRKSVV